MSIHQKAALFPTRLGYTRRKYPPERVTIVSNQYPNARPNRLVDEQSPYLLQHAYNPVEWYPWGTEAFQKAGRESKPVFLSIGDS